MPNIRSAIDRWLVTLAGARLSCCTTLANPAPNERWLIEALRLSRWTQVYLLRKMHEQEDRRRADFIKWDPSTGEVDDVPQYSYDLSTHEGRSRAWFQHLTDTVGGIGPFIGAYGGDKDVWREYLEGQSLDPNRGKTEYQRRQIQSMCDALQRNREEIQSLASNSEVWARLNVMGQGGQSNNGKK